MKFVFFLMYLSERPLSLRYEQIFRISQVPISGKVEGMMQNLRCTNFYMMTNVLQDFRIYISTLIFRTLSNNEDLCKHITCIPCFNVEYTWCVYGDRAFCWNSYWLFFAKRSIFDVWQDSKCVSEKCTFDVVEKTSSLVSKDSYKQRLIKS